MSLFLLDQGKRDVSSTATGGEGETSIKVEGEGEVWPNPSASVLDLAKKKK
jgi:hypothetical protein